MGPGDSVGLDGAGELENTEEGTIVPDGVIVASPAVVGIEDNGAMVKEGESV